MISSPLSLSEGDVTSQQGGRREVDHVIHLHFLFFVPLSPSWVFFTSLPALVA
jgi:hypothetical protein